MASLLLRALYYFGWVVDALAVASIGVFFGGYAFFLVVLTQSMYPTIVPLSTVLVLPVKPGVGDIGVYLWEVGDFTVPVVHRVVEVSNGYYVFKGDNNPGPDPPVPADRVRGTVVAVLPPWVTFLLIVSATYSPYKLYITLKR